MGRFMQAFPPDELPFAVSFVFRLRRVYASYKKAERAFIGASGAYGNAQATLREGMNYYEPQPTSQIDQ